MKKLFAALFSLACTLIVCAADVSLSGVWKVEVEAAGNISTSTLTLKQDSKNLAGTIKMPDGQVLAVKGEVEGSKVKFQYVKNWEGNPLTITHDGILDAAGVINGSTDVQPMGIEGAFVAKREGEKQK